MDEGRLRVAAEHVAEEIDATYRNGVLEVTLPIVTGATQRGRSIEIEA